MLLWHLFYKDTFMGRPLRVLRRFAFIGSSLSGIRIYDVVAIIRPGGRAAR